MSLVMSEYIEVNLVGVILLATMLIYVGKMHDGLRSEEQPFFVRMLVINGVILLSDITIYLLRFFFIYPTSYYFCHAACILYFILHSWFCYNWLRYVLIRLRPRRSLSGPELSSMLVPAAASTLSVAVSPMTGWIYSISEYGVYSRGPFLWTVFAVAILYWLAAGVISFREWLRPTSGHEPGEAVTLLIAPIPLLAGTLLQLRFYGLSIVWVCSAISMLILFIDMQSNRLARDPLTGLYNRGRMNSQLAWEAGHLHSAASPLLVAMFDVDDFKAINDRFGHLSGDRALVFVSEVFRKQCRKSDFVSRYGGDEFLLITHVGDTDAAVRVLGRIDAAVGSGGAAGGFPYPISLSIGYTLCAPGSDTTVDKLLGEADERMYEAKRLKKSTRRAAETEKIK